MIKTPVNILEEDISNLFRDNDKNDYDIIFSTLSLLMYKNEHNSDLAELFKILDYDLDKFTKIVHIFENRTIEFPDSKKLSEQIIISICYYYYKVEGKSWDEIKNLFSAHDLSFLSISLRIHHLEDFMKQRIQEIIKREESLNE